MEKNNKQKLDEIKEIQISNFNTGPKISFTDKNYLVVLNADGSPHKKIDLYSDTRYAFSLDYKHVVIILPTRAFDASSNKRVNSIKIVDIESSEVNWLKLRSASNLILKGILLQGLEFEGEILIALYHEYNSVSIQRISKDVKKITKLASLETNYTYNLPTLHWGNGILYVVSNTLSVFDLSDPKNPKKLRVNEPFNYSLLSTLLGSGNLITIENVGQKFQAWKKEKLVTSISNNSNNHYFQISTVKGSKNDFLLLSTTGSGDKVQRVLSVMRYLEKEKILVELKTRKFYAEYSKFLVLDELHVVLIQPYNTIVFNFITGRALKFDLNLKEDNFVVLYPNDKRNKILKCLLQVKLRKELPKDLILETFTFF